MNQWEGLPPQGREAREDLEGRPGGPERGKRDREIGGSLELLGFPGPHHGISSGSSMASLELHRTSLTTAPKKMEEAKWKKPSN